MQSAVKGLIQRVQELKKKPPEPILKHRHRFQRGAEIWWDAWGPSREWSGTGEQRSRGVSEDTALCC